MNILTRNALKHYAAPGLAARIQAALAPFGPEDTVLSVAQLAMLDQFHTRGIAATAEIAEAAALDADMVVLDLGCGIGGPARYLATAHGVHVVGVDLSPSFVDTARYLSQRCGLADRTVFHVGDAVDLPIDGESIDRVFLLHVAMNINDRAALYRSIHRVLKPGGKLVTYDVVEKAGELHFPVPWSTAPQGSYLLTEAVTRDALVDAGFRVEAWRDDTQTAAQWFAAMQAGGPPPGPNLGLVLGPDFPGMTGNLARNLREGRAGILLAVASR